MTPQIPTYLLAFELTLRPLVAAIALGLIWMGAARMEASAQTRYTTAGALSAALIAWLAIAQYLAVTNAYFAAGPTSPPTVLLGLLTPLIIAFAGVRLSESVARLVGAIPLPWIVAAQIYRVGGAIFLVLWADGRLPWQFALPAGIGDVSTGCFAVVVAARLAQKAGGARAAAYAWNLFGIADLVVAVTMGALTSPGLPHLLAFDAPNLLITSYPLVMVPTFAVPLALMLHGLVLSRLSREANSASRLALDAKPLA
ncbi:MFS transporter [Rhodoblastus sp. 17X3]|uniref:MFS transporter n=1 Tax=Rhodoblastus sp. 17X3 TaxID=3047026 RepID=UPI0024B650C4|nr:MFS transporter [Rhodoblastus sp. 17X3]MDI9847842.1 MFS transporter [Rhodoblastus sp. 17X3]